MTFFNILRRNLYKIDYRPNLSLGNEKSRVQHLEWRKQWHPTPVLLPGKSHGQRSLVGCSPRGHEESDTTERLHFQFSLSHIGEGNGNPLQCSCLENPRDRGAWWAAIYGIAQSRTRLKRLSSSSSSSRWHSNNVCLFQVGVQSHHSIPLDSSIVSSSDKPVSWTILLMKSGLI